MHKKKRYHRFYNWRLDRLVSVGSYVYGNYVSFISWRELLKHKGTKKLRRYMRTWMCITPQYRRLKDDGEPITYFDLG